MWRNQNIIKKMNESFLSKCQWQATFGCNRSFLDFVAQMCFTFYLCEVKVTFIPLPRTFMSSDVSSLCLQHLELLYLHFSGLPHWFNFMQTTCWSCKLLYRLPTLPSRWVAAPNHNLSYQLCHHHYCDHKPHMNTDIPRFNEYLITTTQMPYF